MNVILLLRGCVLEGTVILLVIVSVFIPMAQALGTGMVHFGVVVVVNIKLVLVTRPTDFFTSSCPTSREFHSVRLSSMCSRSCLGWLLS